MKIKTVRKTAGALALCGVLLLASCADENTGQMKTSPPKAEKGLSQKSGEKIDYNGLLNALPQSQSPDFTDFQTISLDGEKIDESIWSGKKLTMVNIWATFCGPCINEMQIVGIVIDVLTSQGISDSQVDLAKDIVAQTSADYTHLLPSGDLIAAKLKDVSSVPETIFLDENGKQVGTSFLGARSAEEWRAVIDGLLKEVS